MGLRCCWRGSPAVGDDDRCAERVDRRAGRARYAGDVRADGTDGHGHTGGLPANRSAAHYAAAYDPPDDAGTANHRSSAGHGP